MHSVKMLVTDRSPESSEHINSVLRNSGIKIHVLHASSCVEIKRSLDNDSPVLILFANPDPEDATLEEVNELADAFSVPLALFTDLSNPDQLAAALKTTPCYVIHSQDERLLSEAVSRLVKNSENERIFTSQQQRLEELEHRYNLLLDSSRDAIAYVHEGLHVYTNRAYLEALHVNDIAEIEGVSLLELVRTGELDLKSILRDLSKGKFPSHPLEVDIIRPDGTEFEANLVFSPARFDGEDCIQMMAQKRDNASDLAAELERLRFVDPLTQLSNRTAFAQHLRAFIDECGSEAESTSAVIYLEPDGFEELQHQLSVDSTDEFLADLAAIIKLCLQPEDRAARIADKGFAILLRRDSNTQIEAAAQRLLQTYGNHVVEIGDRAISSSCSLGIAVIGRLASDSAEILSRARKAQSEAAEKGNQFVVYRPKLTAVVSSDDDQLWIDRIKYALHNQDFYTVQQSIVDLDGEGEQLMENLTFMRDESGDYPPSKFHHIADRNDLAGTIDRNVIPGLLKTLVDGNHKQIISLSNNSILDYGFPGWFSDQLRNNCIEGKNIILQISASTAQANLKPAQRLMKELKPLGCELSISQFDSERRSAQLLQHLDVSYVKIHPSFTEELTGNTKSQEIIRKIVESAESHQVCVIAEEVADTSSLAVLWQCGVKLISGAFLKEPSQVIAQ